MICRSAVKYLKGEGHDEFSFACVKLEAWAGYSYGVVKEEVHSFIIYASLRGSFYIEDEIIKTVKTQLKGTDS